MLTHIQLGLYIFLLLHGYCYEIMFISRSSESSNETRIFKYVEKRLAFIRYIDLEYETLFYFFTKYESEEYFFKAVMI